MIETKSQNHPPHPAPTKHPAPAQGRGGGGLKNVALRGPLDHHHWHSPTVTFQHQLAVNLLNGARLADLPIPADAWLVPPLAANRGIQCQ